AAPYSLNLDTSRLAYGPHQLSARVSDGLGNVGVAATITINVLNASTISDISVSASVPTGAVISWSPTGALSTAPLPVTRTPDTTYLCEMGSATRPRLFGVWVAP